MVKVVLIVCCTLQNFPENSFEAFIPSDRVWVETLQREKTWIGLDNFTMYAAQKKTNIILGNLL